MSLTAVFEANSLNYGEGIANISELKKIHRGNGEVHTFASRQSIRYDVVRLGNELFGWNLNTVDKASGVVQFRKDITIEDSVEMDLFGYLKTGKKSKKRPAVVRLSHAISLEPYRSDLEFLNNMGLAERISEDPNLANIEQHESLYTYTLTIDLAKVGVDANDRIDLPKGTKAERVLQLLEILKVLNRNIRGRQENLSPLLVVGGVYPVANPFFLGKVFVEPSDGGWSVSIDPLEAVMDQTFAGTCVGDYSWLGYLAGIWSNEAQLQDALGDRAISVEEFFQKMICEVQQTYEVVQ